MLERIRRKTKSHSNGNFFVLLIVFHVFSGFLPLYAEKVDMEELRKYLNEKIEFINYTGKHRVVQTAEEIENIGRVLAYDRVISLKYSLYHAVDPTTREGLDADIISIDRDATVDHIDNVRRIIQGYLMEAYDYSRKDAHAIAVFVTIYNAVFRGNLNYYKKKYKPIVVSYLTKENAGISTKYYEWPGKTRLVIPLTTEAEKGEISSVSTTEVTEKSVIESMRNEKGKGIEERKAMVELKEKEVKSKEEKKANIEQEIAGKREKVSKIEAEIEKRKAEGGAKANSEVALLEAKKKEEEKSITELEEKKKKVEKEISIKKGEIKEEQRGIVKDEKETGEKTVTVSGTEEKKAVTTLSDIVFFLKSDSSDTMKYSLAVIDPTTNKLKFVSPVKNITSRTLTFFKGKLLLIGLERPSSENGRVYLCNPVDLQIERMSDRIIYPFSALLMAGDFIFAIVKSGNGYKVARFNEKLEIAAKSEILVNKNSYLAIFGNTLYVSSDRNDINVLRASNLQLITRVLEQ